MLQNKNIITGLVLVVILTGCVGPIDDPTGITGGNNVEGEVPSDAVPERANTVLLADPIGLLQDSTTRDVGNHVIQETMNEDSREFDNYDEALNNSFQEFNDNLETALDGENVSVDVDVNDLGRVIAFAEVDDNITEQGLSTSGVDTEQATEEFDQYGAVIIELDISKEDIGKLFREASDEIEEEEGVEYTSTQYEGFTVYTVEEDNVSASFSVIDEGIHVAGTTEAVRDAIDTYRGDSNRVDESILPNIDDNTYVSVGAQNLNFELDGTSQQVQSLQEDPTLESYSFTYRTDGSTDITLSTEASFESAESAVEINNLSTQQLDSLRNQIEQREQQEGEVSGQLKLIQIFASEDALDVGRTGSTIETSVEVTTEELKDGIDIAIEGQESSAVAEPDRADRSRMDNITQEQPDGPRIRIDTNATAKPEVTVNIVENENVDTLEVRSNGELIDENLIDSLENKTGSQTYNETDGIQNGGIIELTAISGGQEMIRAVRIPESSEEKESDTESRSGY